MGLEIMIIVYSPTESEFADNGLAVLQPLSCVISVTINGAWSLTLEQPFDADGKYKFIEKNNIIKIDNIPIIREQTSQYQLFRIYDTVKDITAGKITAIAFPVAFEATYDAIIEELKIDKKTATAALTDIMTYLSQHGMTKYTVTCDGTGKLTRQRKGSWTNTNLIAAISGSDEGSIINHWGGEVAYDNYKIVVNGSLGQTTGYEIRCGKNLTGLEIDTDMSGVVTRLFPISSDDVRLKRTVSGQEVSYVDSNLRTAYPFTRAAFVKTSDKLVDTSWKLNEVNSDTAVLTHQAQVQIAASVKELMQGLWVAIMGGNSWHGTFVEPEWLQSVIGDVSESLQKEFTKDIVHPSWKTVASNAIKEGIVWIKKEEIPDFEWNGNYNDGYTYDNGYRTIKNQYYYIDRRYCYFSSTGEYHPWKDVDSMTWIQPKTNSAKKKFGDNKRYYAKDTYINTWGDDGSGNQQVNEYWFDGDGWWDGTSNTAANWDWHGSGTAADPYWYGESGASETDTGKYAHDCWMYIYRTNKGLYYFDEKGHLKDELTYDPSWNWHEDKGRYYFGSTNKSQNAVYIKNQWLKAEGVWKKFDNDGYVLNMDSVKSGLIALLKTELASGVNQIVSYYEGLLYDLLYGKLVDYCNDLYDSGNDKPVLNITANMIDLSQTAEYKGYIELEKIHLGDKVKIIDYIHGFGESNNSQIIELEERIVGLKYDVIMGYNTEVTISDPSKLVSQIVNNNSMGNSGGTYRQVESSGGYVAGENITIDGNVINAVVPQGDNIAGDKVTVEQIATSGNHVASIYVNDHETEIYGGSAVSITPRLNQGTKVADYSIDGNNGSLYAPSGLQYWTETEKKINKLTSVALPNHKTWDCDDVWKTTGFAINFPFWEQAYGYPYMFQKATASLAFGCYSTITWEGNLHYVIILFSAVDEGADIDIYLATVASDAPYELDGLTFYKSAVIIMPYTSVPAPTDPPPYVKTGHLQYLDYAADHGGEYGTYDETLAYFLEISNFRTRDVYYSGIGNNNEYVIWGGYSKKSNPEITDMPFYVTDDGVIVCEDIYIDGSKPLKDVRKNGASIVSNQIADITNFTGATSESNGAAGLVPAPLIADKNKYLRGDCTWQTLTIPEIEANPSDTATETLEKVEIDGTVYEIGGKSKLEDLEDVNINNVVDGEVLKFDEASQKWINGTGGGGASEIVTEIIGNHQNFIPKYSSLQSVGWSYDGYALHFSCDDGSESDMKCQAVYRVAIPSTVKKIRYRFQTGVRKSSSASDNYKVCIGIKSTLDTTNYSTPNDSDFIVKKLYSTEQHTYEDSIEFTVSEPVYLYIIGNGWFLDVFEIELIEYAGGGGSDEPQKIDMFDGASTITPTASNGITVSTSSVSNMVGAISGSEWSNGYEGFNIAVKNLSIGKDYILKFDWKFTNTAYFVGQYVVGYKLFTTNKSNYDDWGAWVENLDRDDQIHSHELSFNATATTMYLCFNLCGCADTRTNYWDISNMYLLELPTGNVEANPSGTATERLTKLRVNNTIYSIPSGGSGIDYSTLEQDTGMKWVDGKEIYQKTYYIASVSTGGNFYNLSNSQDNVDSFVSYEWMATRSDGKHIMNNSFMPDWIGGSTGISEWDYDINHIRVKISAEYYSLSDVYITVRYTKRTS